MTVISVGPTTFAHHLGEWRREGRSLAESIADAVQDAVRDGRVLVGTRLPAERELADALAVSRGTLVASLRMLRTAGWLETGHGSGSTVRLPPGATRRTAPWSADRWRRGGAGTPLDLTGAAPAAPHEEYLDAVRRTHLRLPTLLVDDGESGHGLTELRAILAERFTAQGLPTTVDQIAITSGAQSALMLLAHHLVSARQRVIVETPTFPGALSAFRSRGARLAGVAVTADGHDVDALARLAAAAPGQVAYLTPDFHNPTGNTLGETERAAVRSIVDRHRITLVVDETMRDLDLSAEPRPLNHLATSSAARTITVGTASKVVWGGLRVGWIRASTAFVRELRLNPLFHSLSPPPMEQLVAAELFGRLEPILRARRRELRGQRDHLVGLLAGGDDWSFRTPSGGLTLWLRLHRVSAPAVAEAAARHGLTLSTGPEFAADRSLDRYLRLPFTLPTDGLDRAVDRLRQAYDDAVLNATRTRRRR